MKRDCLLTLLAVRKQTISFHQSATDTEKSVISRCLVAEDRECNGHREIYDLEVARCRVEVELEEP